MSLPTPSVRDPRLDFFRGLGMFIILVAHITNNPWALWIPARFGFSDATEMFVFCSGMASAIAFGGTFARAGFGWGTLRIAYRIWQVYWVHIGVFLCTLFAMLVINRIEVFPGDQVAALNLYQFLRSAGPNMVGLMTLTYVPNYFDVLPMYLVILALIPPMIALSRLHVLLPIAVSLVLWLAADLGRINLPAELWFLDPSTRTWFFNPFAWQLVFFTGFALMSGWLPAPPVNRWLIGLAIAIVVLSVPFAWYKIINASEAVRDWRGAWKPLFDKTNFGILRYVHFLALAYLAWIAVGPGGARLKHGTVWTGFVAIVSRVGTQSLAVFAASMVLARILGAFLDLTGRGFTAALAINLLGFALVIGVAELATLIKRHPWKDAVRAAPRTLAPAGEILAPAGEKVKA